jgi:hypothetical protein
MIRGEGNSDVHVHEVSHDDEGHHIVTAQLVEPEEEMKSKRKRSRKESEDEELIYM